MGESTAPWWFGREDRRMALMLIAFPLLVAAPRLLGYFNADPILYLGHMSRDVGEGLLRGVPYIDPNHGLTTQALGALAARQWLEGSIPWWNHYSGIGLPLAAEYQAGAFFPPTLLLLLPNGTVWYHLVLEIAASLGTYGLLRQLGISRATAACASVVYGFNGTLAWFAHGPAGPVPFLPWMLWGIERARAAAHRNYPEGWRMLAASMALILLAPFPETAYLSGLLALGWAGVRGLSLPGSARVAYAARIAAGGVAGIAIAAPQVVPFFQFLPLAEIGEHGDRFAHEAMMPTAIIPTLVAPYFFGPIFAHVDRYPWLFAVWGAMGGYATLALVASAAHGFWARRDALAWFLILWVLLAVGRTFGFPFLSHVWNLVPGVSFAAFYRYATPAWTLALVILAARGLDVLASGATPRGARFAAMAVMIAGLAAVAWCAWPLRTEIQESVQLRNWGAGSLLLACAAAFAVLRQLRTGGLSAATIAGVILAVEAAVMFAIPTLSTPRRGSPDLEAVRFLRENLGLQRFYTLGPIQANYGAYFATASINYNYLPNSRQWYLWVRNNLDTQAHSVVFNGTRPGEPTPAEMLRRNRSMYEQVGVRFVVAPKGSDPLRAEAKRVYTDDQTEIYELPGAMPYFESASGACSLSDERREGVVAECTRPDRLIRRELFFPGWRATVSGLDTPVEEALELYQSVQLPAGRSAVVFRYAPPYIGWSYLASALGLAAFAGWRGPRRRAP